jgi:hypothetical protein
VEAWLRDGTAAAMNLVNAPMKPAPVPPESG